MIHVILYRDDKNTAFFLVSSTYLIRRRNLLKFLFYNDPSVLNLLTSVCICLINIAINHLNIFCRFSAKVCNNQYHLL